MIDFSKVDLIQLTDRFNSQYPVGSKLKVKIGRREPELVIVIEPARIVTDLMYGTDNAWFVCGIGKGLRVTREVWVMNAYYDEFIV